MKYHSSSSSLPLFIDLNNKSSVQKYPFNSKDKMVCRLRRFPCYVTMILLWGATTWLPWKLPRNQFKYSRKETQNPRTSELHYLKLPESNSSDSFELSRQRGCPISGNESSFKHAIDFQGKNLRFTVGGLGHTHLQPSLQDTWAKKPTEVVQVV